jgi:hypothetical protein
MDEMHVGENDCQMKEEIRKSAVKRHFNTKPSKKHVGVDDDNVWIWMELSLKAIESKVDDKSKS